MDLKERFSQGKGISLGHLFKVLLFLSIVAAIVYGNSVKNEFVFDDRHLVEKNLFIRDSENLPMLFKTGLHHFENVFQGEGTFYRPMIGVTYMIDYFLYALDPFGYHLSNILWHVFAAFLVYILIRLIFREFIIGAVTSVFFLIHPVQTEAVTYISGRADLVVTVFILLYLVFFALDLQKARRSDFLTLEFIISNLALLFAFLSKEISMIALPLALLVFYMYRNREGKSKQPNFLYPYIASFIVLLLIYFKFRSNALGDWTYERLPLPLAERIMSTILVIPEYFRILLFPFGLHMERTVTLPSSFLDLRLLSSFLFLLAICAIAIIYSKKSQGIFFGTTWVLVSIFPFLNIIPLNAAMAEHWLYIPLIGFSFLAAYIMRTVYRKINGKFLKAASILFFCTIMSVYGVLTVRQNTYWRDGVTFYERTLAFSPGSIRCIGNLANIYTDRGEHKKAVDLFRKGIDANPKEYQLYNNLANVYANTGDYRQAEETLLAAIKINPKASFPYNNLGVIYEEQGKTASAEDAYKNAIRLDDNFYEAYYNLGTLLYQQGRIKEAKEHLARVEDINPGYKETRRLLGE